MSNKRFVIHFENHMTGRQSQFYISAKNEFRAGRLFYKLYNYKYNPISWIENYDSLKHFWTEQEIIEKLNKD